MIAILSSRGLTSDKLKQYRNAVCDFTDVIDILRKLPGGNSKNITKHEFLTSGVSKKTFYYPKIAKNLYLDC